jgi:hypothetical protein
MRFGIAVTNDRTASQKRGRQTILSFCAGVALTGCIASEAAELNLDLASSERSIPASLVLPDGTSASILQDGSSVSISSQDNVTPGQYVALTQVLSGTPQAISLSSTGVASGGTLQISSSLNTQIANLSVPAGLTVLQNTDHTSSFSLTGNFINNGLYQFIGSSSSAVPTLEAQNIVNYGTITSHLSDALGGISGLSSSLGFTLRAEQDIVNYGTISSAGQLSLVAGGSISNIGAASIMQAQQNLEVWSVFCKTVRPAGTERFAI